MLCTVQLCIEMWISDRSCYYRVMASEWFTMSNVIESADVSINTSRRSTSHRPSLFSRSVFADFWFTHNLLPHRRRPRSPWTKWTLRRRSQRVGLLARGREGDGVVDPVLGRTAGNEKSWFLNNNKKLNQFLLRLIISAKSREEVNGEGLNTTSGEQETWYRWNNSWNISHFHVFRWSDLYKENTVSAAQPSGIKIFSEAFERQILPLRRNILAFKFSSDELFSRDHAFIDTFQRSHLLLEEMFCK